MRRDDTFNILSIYIVDEYLSCTKIKKNFLNSKKFYDWVVNELLSHCNVFSASRNVICMNNLSIYCNSRIKETIEAHDCLIWYLSSYSSNYNSIELTFSMLKTWMRRHFRQLRTLFESDFENFIAFAIEKSECDKKTKEHFKHNVEEYMFESDYETFRRKFDT